MPLFQQDQPFLVDVPRVHPRIRRPLVARRHGQQERILEQRRGLDLVISDRQREHHHIERTVRQFLDQRAGLRLAQFHAQIRMMLLQRGQNFRQHIRSERRNDAELQPAGEQPSAMARELFEVARRRQHLPGPPRHLAADLGEDHLARPPLDERSPELGLQVLDLHRQGRLCDGAGLGRPAEVAVLRQGQKITQLLEGRHAR